MFCFTADPKPLVGCNDRRLIVDGRDADVHGAGLAVLPQLRLIGPDGEAVCPSFTAVVNVGDVLTLHLEEKSWVFY